MHDLRMRHSDGNVTEKICRIPAMGSADHSGCLFLFVGDDGVAVSAQGFMHLRIAEAVLNGFSVFQFFLFHTQILLRSLIIAENLYSFFQIC